MKPLKLPSLPHVVRGFTLVEILVVMTLLSLVMLGMASAMRTMADTETRVDARLARIDKVRTIDRFLQQVLGRVSYQRASSLNRAAAPTAGGGQSGETLRFEARSDSIAWVGIMPARPAMGGRYFFRLAAEPAGSGHNLVLRHVPWSPEQAELFPDWASAASEVILRDITVFSVEAQADRAADVAAQATWSPDWQTGWAAPNTLPERLRLRIADAAGDWPQMVIRVRATAITDRSSGGFVIGGGGGR